MSADEDDKKGPTETGGPQNQRKREKSPVTIDLAAEPTDKATPTPPPSGEPERPDAQDAVEGRTPPPSTPPPPPPPGQRGGGSGRVGVLALVVAAVIGGVIATVLGILYHASGVVPTRSETVAREALGKVEELGATVVALDKRLATIESRPAGSDGADLAALSDKLAAVASLQAENRVRIEKLEAMPAPPASAPGGDGSGGAAVAAALDDLKARLAKLETDVASGADTASAVSALTERVAALESSTKDLGSQVAALAARPAESERAARAAAIGMLQQAGEKGGPFTADLAMLKALGLDEADLAALAPLAAKDTPSVATLQGQFPAVADAILVATSSLGSDAGFFDRLAAFGRGLVTVRPTTPVSGDTSEAVVSRMQAAVDSGDLAKALTERGALPPEGQTASADWAQAAQDRVAIDRLIDKLALSVTAPGN